MNNKEIFDKNIKSLELDLECKNLYFFGAGNICKTFFEAFPLKDKVVGIFDNNLEKIGVRINTIEIQSAEQLEFIEVSKSVFIITTFYCNEIREQLVKLGIKEQHIYHYYYLGFNKQDLVVHPKLDRNDVEKIDEIRNFLQDEESKLILDKIVDCRNREEVFWGYGYSYFPYFDQEIIEYSDQEVFVDGGAFTGDTLEVFFKMSNNKFLKAFVYEPDANNYKKLFNTYGLNSKVVCEEAGLWSENTNLRFSSGNSTASTISEWGDSTIKVKSIDEDIKDEITFIKMDIEGAELEALIGAKNTIKKYKPKLAIAIYHKEQDLWEIPKWIKSLVPEYKLYIRHHSFALDDTVLYAVCD